MSVLSLVFPSHSLALSRSLPSHALALALPALALPAPALPALALLRARALPHSLAFLTFRRPLSQCHAPLASRRGRGTARSRQCPARCAGEHAATRAIDGNGHTAAAPTAAAAAAPAAILSLPASAARAAARGGRMRASAVAVSERNATTGACRVAKRIGWRCGGCAGVPDDALLPPRSGDGARARMVVGNYSDDASSAYCGTCTLAILHAAPEGSVTQR